MGKVCFPTNSGHWMETFLQFGNLFRQFHRNCFLRALCNFFVDNIFCVMIHKSSFLDIYWKKPGFLVKSCWRLLCFPHLWQKCILCLQRNFWVNFSPKKVFFTFWKTERNSFGSLVEVLGTSVKTAVSVPKKNNLIFFEKFVLNIFFFFNWAIEVQLFVSFFPETLQKFLFASKVVFCGEIYSFKNPGNFFRKRSQNDFGFLTNIFPRNVKCAFYLSIEILRSFSGMKIVSLTYVNSRQKSWSSLARVF